MNNKYCNPLHALRVNNMYMQTEKNNNSLMTRLINKQFNHLQWNSFILSGLISTQPQFYVFSGGFFECLYEPWHVGRSTAGSFHTNALLPIPQSIIVIQQVAITLFITACLTVVVVTNKRRDLTGSTHITGTAVTYYYGILPVEWPLA